MAQRLQRSRTNRVLFGVCGGLGEYLGVDPVLVRVVFLLLLFAGGIGILLYLVLAVLTPLEGAPGQSPAENVRSLGQEAAQVGEQVRSAVSGTGSDEEVQRRRRVVGLVLLVVGLVVLAANLGAFWWFDWGVFWAALLILAGVLLLLARARRG